MAAGRHTRREWTFGRTLWFSLVLLGWFGLAYIAVTVPGGIYAAWEWVLGQGLLVQILMWLLLLPYMLAMWLWAMPWAESLRIVAVLAVFVASLVLSRPRAR